MQHRFTRVLESATLAAAGLLGVTNGGRAASCAETLLSTPTLTRFAAIVQQAGLAPQLGSSQLTMFAPSNAALNGILSITQMLGGPEREPDAGRPQAAGPGPRPSRPRAPAIAPPGMMPRGYGRDEQSDLDRSSHGCEQTSREWLRWTWRNS